MKTFLKMGLILSALFCLSPFASAQFTETPFIAWSPDGSKIVVGQGPLEKESIYSIEWSPDGATIAVSGGALKCDPGDLSKFSIRLIDASSGQVTKNLQGHTCATTGLDWSPDGDKLVSVSALEDKAYIWNVAEERVIVSIPPDVYGMSSAVWQPHGDLIASNFLNGTTTIWDSTTGNLVAGTDIYGHAVDWSPDGTRLVIGSGYGPTISVVDASTLQEVLELQGHSDGVVAVAWSPDGEKIASGSADQTARIWDAITGDNLITLQGHTDVVSAVAWSPNNTTLASGSSDGTIRLWDAQTGELVDTIEAGGQVRSIAWSPDDTKLAYGNSDGAITIIPAPTSVATPTPTAHDDFIPPCMRTCAKATATPGR